MYKKHYSCKLKVCMNASQSGCYDNKTCRERSGVTVPPYVTLLQDETVQERL